MALGNIGRRDDRVTASLPTSSYDDDGKLVTTGTSTISFWADISDEKSGTDSTGGGKRRNVRVIKLIADSRDVAELTNDHVLTYEGSTDRFQVFDFYDSEFRFTTEIIAQYIK